MLEALRRGAASWVAKIFIGLLVLSFAVWGIADIFRGYGGDSLAEVGDQEITAEQYRLAYQNETRRMSNQLGRLITPDEARLLSLDQRVLARLVGEAALESHAQNLDLGISDKAIAQTTVKTPAFQDASGNFNQQLFLELLRANGLSEQGYVALERNASLRRQLTQTIGDVEAVPQVLMDAANRFQNETRTLSYFTLPDSKLDALAAPTEEQLKTYYDDHKQAYTAPEYRKLGLLIVTPETLASTIEVTDEDVKKEFEAKKDSFGSPERRHVLQMSFQDKAAAAAAHDKLKQGEDFMQVAKANGYKESDVDLGTVAKTQLADPTVAEAAFKLEPGTVSEPIEGDLSTSIVKVTDVTPAVVKTFDDVKDQIRKSLATQRANNEILDFHDKIEDERAAGKTLPEIGSGLNLKYVEIPEVDNGGRAPDGKPVEMPSPAQVIQTAFQSDVGVENDPVETADHGFVWVDVQGVTPSRQKPFEEVRADVERDWRAAEERSRLAKKAQEIVDQIRKGETIQAAAQALSLEVKDSQPLKRNDTSQELPRAAVAQAFALSDGGVGSAPADDGKARVIFKVVKVTPPPPLSEDQAKALREALQSQLADDMISEYVTGLRDGYGVRVNQTLLNQLTGREGG